MKLYKQIMHGSDFQKRLEIYNDYYIDKPKLQIILNETEHAKDEEVYQGNLRVYWGIIQPIRLKLKDDSLSKEIDAFNRHSYSYVDPNRESQLDYFMNLSKSSNFDGLPDSPVQSPEPGTRPPGASGQVGRSQSSVVMRPQRRRPKKRLSIINGHLFSAESSMFTPMHGSLMNVNVTTLDSTSNVIKLILNKFKVDNAPNEFCLCAIRASGETRILGDSVVPLVERIRYGPLEDDVKFFLVEKYRVVNINEEVASFVNLPDAVLEAFLLKYANDEQLEMEMIMERYNLYKEKLEELLGDAALLT